MDERLIKPGMNLVPEGLRIEDELIFRRTLTSKHFFLENRKHKAVTSIGRIHYEKGGKIEDIDLRIREENGKKVVRKAPYDIEIYTDKVGYSYVSKKGGRVDVELVEVGGQAIDNKRFAVRIEGNVFWWDNVADGVDMKLILKSLGIEIFKRLANSTAPRKFKWKISEDVGAKASFKRQTRGIDEKKQALQINYKVLDEKVVKNKKEFFYEEIWTGKIGEIADNKSRVKTWTDNVVYPVVIDAQTSEQIIANNDDGWEADGDFWRPITGIYTRWVAGYRSFASSIYNGGLRYQALGIPQGATIDKAELKGIVQGIVGVPQLKIYGDNVDNASAWSNNNLPSDITKTTANLAWSPTATGAFVLGITNIVQEIISRTGWASGDIRFGIIDQYGFGTNWVLVVDYNKSQAEAVYLEVSYTPAPEYTFDTKAQDIESSVNPRVLDYTCGAGATLLILSITTKGGPRTGGSPTYGGTPLTIAGSPQSSGDEGYSELWYLLEPTTESLLEISVPNDDTDEVNIIASSYKAQAGYTSEFDVTNQNGAVSANPSVSVTPSEKGSVTVDSLFSGFRDVPDGNNRVLLFQNDTGNESVGAQYNLQIPTSAVPMSWTQDSDDWALVVASFKQVRLSNIKKFVGVVQLSIKKVIEVANASIKKLAGVSNV